MSNIVAVKKIFILLALATSAVHANAQYNIRGHRTPVKKHMVTSAPTPQPIPGIHRTPPPKKPFYRTHPNMVEHMTGIVDNIPSKDDERILYLTLNLPSGGFDAELVDWLAMNKIPATFFISVRWVFPLQNQPTRTWPTPVPGNPTRLAQFRKIYKNPLFMVGNSGYENIPASVDGKSAWGIIGTGNLKDLDDEIMVGRHILANAVAYQEPTDWYRSGGAMYDSVAVRYIDSIGIKIAGFAISVDGGGTLTESDTYNEMMRAKSGDILSGMANRSDSDTAKGIIRAITELRRRGFVFKKLPQVEKITDGR